ncbi:MAG TPA: carboxypeptidase-like regulatory domain-containing protein [Bryobacteraceae bacterium]|nr:carboxypeptidase-like regulatory domain-containing protein [Bryobacteraceae bacterium]
MLSRCRSLLALLFSAGLVIGAESDTRIKVEVLTLGGKPIDRAAVIVDFVEGRSVTKLGKKSLTHWEVRTNQEGIAKLPALPPGKVRVQVVARGYQTFGQTYDIEEPEKTLTIKLNPPQPPHSEHQ